MGLLGTGWPSQVAPGLEVICLHTSREMNPRVCFEEVVGKPLGSLDGDQRMRADGWPLNLSCHRRYSCQDFTGDSKPPSNEIMISLARSPLLLPSYYHFQPATLRFQ